MQPGLINMSVPVCAPVLSDMNEGQRKLMGNPRPVRDFVDYHEESDLGFFVLSLFVKIKRVKTSEGIIVTPQIPGKTNGIADLGPARYITMNRENPRDVLVVTCVDNFKDLTIYDVRLSCKNNTHVFFVRPGWRAEEALAARYVVIMSVHDIFAKPGMYERFFPHKYTTLGGAEAIRSLINSFLSRKLGGRDFCSGITELYDKYKMSTYGHLIYAILLEKCGRDFLNLGGINIRLFFLFLITCARDDPQDLRHHVEEFFNWLILETCDSCLEKILMRKMSPSEMNYALTAVNDPLRPFWLAKAKGAYTIYEHGTDLSYHDYSLIRMTHGAFTMSAFRDVVEFYILVDTDASVKVTMNTGSGIVLRESLSLLVRACRGARYGNYSVLPTWYNSMYQSTGSFRRSTNYILELVDISVNHPSISGCCKFLCLSLYFIVPPDALISCCNDADNYDPIMRALIKTSPPDVCGVLGYLFNCFVPREQKEEFLNSSRREMWIFGRMGHELAPPNS